MHVGATGCASCLAGRASGGGFTQLCEIKPERMPKVSLPPSADGNNLGDDGRVGHELRGNQQQPRTSRRAVCSFKQTTVPLVKSKLNRSCFVAIPSESSRSPQPSYRM